MDIFSIFEIYNTKNKIVGILPGEISYDQNLNKKYILIHDEYIIKKGYVIKHKTTDDKDMHHYENSYYVTDVIRQTNSQGPTHKLKVFCQDESAHIEKIKSERNFWIPTIISIIALIKSFSPELASLLKLIMQLLK